uniref:Sulfite exporter TauE/SafE family protein n=1 Tax=Oryza rufipogon TaxID=4529 RepID=A0A0E0P0Q2_ORYRU
MAAAAGLYGRLNRSSTRGFLAYVAAGAACAAVLACFVIPAAEPRAGDANGGLRLSSRSVRVWPDLAFNWRVVVATVVGFLGSAFGTVGGVGGGGIFVPMLNLLVGFDTKSAAALSKCMIMGASASSVWYNLQVSHPTKEAPVIDYKLALLFQPMLMLGITIGVELSVIFPYWLITVLIIILFIGTSSRSFYKGILMWKDETRIQWLLTRVVKSPSYASLSPRRNLLWWKNILVLMTVWSSFLVLQIFKNNSQSCSTFYWVINILQVPVALSVFLWEGVQLCRESRARRMDGNWECVCEASIEWSPAQLIFCAFCGLLGGTVGGLLGSGGGFILGPLLLELGCIPQVASATATFVMMFSSSLSVVEFYFLNRFPIPFAVYLICISILAGFWGQSLVRKLVHVLKRASLIVFILSSVIFASALTMGVVGTQKSISMINNHEYMGFLDFCEK